MVFGWFKVLHLGSKGGTNRFPGEVTEDAVAGFVEPWQPLIGVWVVQGRCRKGCSDRFLGAITASHQRLYHEAQSRDTKGYSDSFLGAMAASHHR